MDKYKKLLGNTVIFGIGSLGTKLLGFILVALYTRVMSEEDYGTTQILYDAVNVLVPLVTFSMSDAVIRFGMDKEYDCRRVYTCANVCLLLGMTVYMLFTPLVALNGKLGPYSFLLYVWCYFSCFRQIASQFVRARGYVKLFALDGIISVLVQVICNLVMLLGLKMGIKGYILSIIISDGFSLCFLTLTAGLYKYLDGSFYSRRLIKKMLKFSAPLIPTYLLWWITSSSDKWLVDGMVGEAETGIYSIAYKLPTLLMFVTTMFYNAWQISSIEERDSRYLGKFYEDVFGAYTSLLYIAASGLIMLCRPLTVILAGSGDKTRFLEAYMFTPILIAAMIYQCFCQFLSSVYTTKKRSVNSCLTALVAAAVNIALNILLIPEYGVWGAAVATAAAYFACFAVRVFDARRFIFFKVDYFRLIVNTLITVFMCIIMAKQPKMYGLGLVIGFIVSLLYNFDAVIKTLRQIFRRNSSRGRRSDAVR